MQLTWLLLKTSSHMCPQNTSMTGLPTGILQCQRSQIWHFNVIMSNKIQPKLNTKKLSKELCNCTEAKTEINLRTKIFLRPSMAGATTDRLNAVHANNCARLHQSLMNHRRTFRRFYHILGGIASPCLRTPWLVPWWFCFRSKGRH